MEGLRMKEAEYLQELEAGLEGCLPPEETREILEEYRSFFAAGREEGRGEEEISESLGSPGRLARQLGGTEPPSPRLSSAPPVTQGPEAVSFARRAAAALIDRALLALALALVMALTIWLAKLGTNTASSGSDPQTGAVVVMPFGLWFIIPLFLLTPLFSPLTLFGISGFIALFMVLISVPVSGGFWFSPLIWLMVFLLSLYKPVAECLWNGRTVGRRLMGIRVTAADGGRAGVSKLLVRELVGDALLGALTAGISTIVSLFLVAAPPHRGIPDRLAGTMVVRDRKDGA